MGDKQPSVRTLDDGSKVTHYPSGEQVMLPSNTLSAALTVGELEDAHQWLDAEKTYARLLVVEEKRAAQAAGDPVPNDKSPL